jgi:hypothetical protein
MNWQTFFDLSTMAHRHLVYVYAGTLAAQLGYAGWIAKKWFSLGKD